MSLDKKALIAQISHNVANIPPPTETPKENAPPKPKTVRKGEQSVTTLAEKSTQIKTSSITTGKPGAFWIDDSDRQIFHELGMLLYTQGIKPSDSLILRAAIRLMPRDHRFIEQIRILQTQDGRKVRHQHDSQIAK